MIYNTNSSFNHIYTDALFVIQTFDCGKLPQLSLSNAQIKVTARCEPHCSL